MWPAYQYVDGEHLKEALVELGFENSDYIWWHACLDVGLVAEAQAYFLHGLN